MSMLDNAKLRTADGGINPKVIVGGIIAVLALVFIFQNTGSATVSFLWLDLDLPGWIWMLILFLAGVAVGSVFPWFRRKSKGTA